MTIFRWMSDKELLRDYTRMVIDNKWLEKMATETKEGPAKKHYEHQHQKEKKRIEAYEAELKKRKLILIELNSDESLASSDSGCNKRDRGFARRTA